MHQEVKWLIKQQRRSYSKIAIFEDKDEELHTKGDKMELVWNNYIRKLYGNSHRGEIISGENQLEYEAPVISMDELNAAIQSVKLKVAGGRMRHRLHNHTT